MYMYVYVNDKCKKMHINIYLYGINVTENIGTLLKLTAYILSLETF